MRTGKRRVQARACLHSTLGTSLHCSQSLYSREKKCKGKGREVEERRTQATQPSEFVTQIVEGEPCWHAYCHYQRTPCSPHLVFDQDSGTGQEWPPDDGTLTPYYRALCQMYRNRFAQSILLIFQYKYLKSF